MSKLTNTSFLIQSAELSSWQRRVAELNNKVSELEDRLSKGEKELAKKQDECVKLQRDLRENVAQKEDQVSATSCKSGRTEQQSVQTGGPGRSN